ncbi:MAG: beta-lactamase family protein [Acidobacteriota bacterium]|nr:beta-lactamase family protein [Acidobacteriota bacterium]
MIESFLKSEIDVGSFPSAAWAVGDSRKIIAEGAVGNAVVVPVRIPATLDTIYDCASLTKPLVTAALTLQSIKNIDDKYLGFTYRDLLTHTSGLRAWLPLYARDAKYVDTILKEGPGYERGKKVVYSDLNFILLWSALTDYLARAKALLVDGAMFNPRPSLRSRIAATEWGQRYEAKMANIPAPRDRLIWGETHDGNAFFAGGTAGNAGLFATARAVFRMAQGWVNAEILPREIVDAATRNQTEGLDDARGFGWQLPTGSEATKMLSSRAFGHTGFTGTSVWFDPDRDRIMVLLTNRVHPCAAPINIQRIRGEFHRMALAV